MTALITIACLLVSLVSALGCACFYSKRAAQYGKLYLQDLPQLLDLRGQLATELSERLSERDAALKKQAVDAEAFRCLKCDKGAVEDRLADLLLRYKMEIGPAQSYLGARQKFDEMQVEAEWLN